MATRISTFWRRHDGWAGQNRSAKAALMCGAGDGTAPRKRRDWDQRQPGQFFAVHSIATDSKGNIFTTETYEGRRLQKFTYKGIGAVAREQGTVWPK